MGAAARASRALARNALQALAPVTPTAAGRQVVTARGLEAVSITAKTLKTTGSEVAASISVVMDRLRLCGAYGSKDASERGGERTKVAAFVSTPARNRHDRADAGESGGSGNRADGIGDKIQGGENTQHI